MNSQENKQTVRFVFMLLTFPVRRKLEAGAGRQHHPSCYHGAART